MAHRRFLFTVRLKNRPVRFSRIGLFSEVLMEHHKLRNFTNFYCRNDRQTDNSTFPQPRGIYYCLSVIISIIKIRTNSQCVSFRQNIRQILENLTGLFCNIAENAETVAPPLQLQLNGQSMTGIVYDRLKDCVWSRRSTEVVVTQLELKIYSD